MEASSQSRVSGGLWNNQRPAPYSKETQDMLKLMMQESKLTNIQRKRIGECLKNGTVLPLASDFKSPASPSQPKTSKCVTNLLPPRRQRRSAELCRAGNSYMREKFKPGPTRDLEKEKRRLQNILEKGKDEPEVTLPRNSRPRPMTETQPTDRYDEVLAEIEERRQFLVDMASLGQEKKYINMINTEISQRLRELELMDKTCRHKSDTVTPERNESCGGHMMDKVDFKETGEEDNDCL